MKTKDIQVGEFYAIGTKSYNQRALITEVGVHRDVFSGWGYHTSNRPDGIEIKYDAGPTDVVQNRQVLRTWDEQAACNSRTDAVEVGKQNRLHRCNDIAKMLSEKLGVELNRPSRPYNQRHRISMEPQLSLSLEQLEAILTAVEKLS